MVVLGAHRHVESHRPGAAARTGVRGDVWYATVRMTYLHKKAPGDEWRLACSQRQGKSRVQPTPTEDILLERRRRGGVRYGAHVLSRARVFVGLMSFSRKVALEGLCLRSECAGVGLGMVVAGPLGRRVEALMEHRARASVL